MIDPRPSPAETPKPTGPNRGLHYAAIVAIVVVLVVLFLAVR